MSGLNKDIPTPLYHQLKDVILQGILAGRWKPDEQLPTENDLAQRYEVSKITVRQALRELATLGYVRREQGRGTFVQRPPLEQGPRELTSFTDEMRRHGMAASSHVLEQGTIPAPADVALRLRMRQGEPVFRLRRLRLADGEPMGIQTAFLPVEVVPGLPQFSFRDASLYEVLHTRFNLRPVAAKETHVSVLIGEDEGRLLQVAPGSPGMSAERVAYLANNRPLELVHSLMRGDRYKIVLDLTADLGARRS